MIAWSDCRSSTAWRWGRSGGRPLHILLTEAPCPDTKPAPLTRHIVRPGEYGTGVGEVSDPVYMSNRVFNHFKISHSLQTLEEEHLSSDLCHSIKTSVTAIYGRSDWTIHSFTCLFREIRLEQVENSKYDTVFQWQSPTFCLEFHIKDKTYIKMSFCCRVYKRWGINVCQQCGGVTVSVSACTDAVSLYLLILLPTLISQFHSRKGLILSAVTENRWICIRYVFVAGSVNL